MTDTEKINILSSAKNYAIASFVLGLLSILNFCSGCLFFVPIISLILGIISINKTKSVNSSNDGLAVAGVVLSIICIVIGIGNLILSLTVTGFSLLPICFMAPFAVM